MNSNCDVKSGLRVYRADIISIQKLHRDDVRKNESGYGVCFQSIA